MSHRSVAGGTVLLIAFSGFVFGQGNQATPQQGQRTFTTNGNGGIVDAPAQPGQRGQRGQAAPSKPAPRNANGRVLLGAPLGESGLWIP